MSIQSEEITIKEFTSGTTLFYFSTHLTAYTEAQERDPSIIYSPTILEIDIFNQPVRASTFDGEHLWSMNDDNIHVPISEISDNYLTGYSYVEDVDYIVEQDRVDVFKERFTDKINDGLSSGGTIPLIPAHTEYVVPVYHEIDDFYVNIKINRTFDTLDTLSIYNNVVNSMPTQEADTGVVFGRLMALQNIKDTEGNNIKIPLRNVPIGIFNPSDDYPTSSSVSESGDRLFLNLKETSEIDEYFNIESFSADTGYLRTASQFTSVPDQYKYVTTTNENGEFIIYDAPIGTQIVVFEVDMFKQGLTKDEIALNFFPFQADLDVPVDNVPSFSFKQFPIEVVPAWGTIQTGYTELNVTVNYDLRKWATYYVTPMAYEGNLLGSIELLEFSPSLNLSVRDMSKEGFPVKNIPVVEIHNITDKDEDQQLLWNSEFIQQKSIISFFEHGYKAFKLRANMYDPAGFRTDSEGIPRTHPTSQGVWLAGYELLLYYNQKSSIFRATGFGRDWGFISPGWRGRDHFHLNRGAISDEANSSVEPLTTVPYDRPWDHLYPNKYSIPAKPTVLNFTRNNYATRITDVSGAAYLEQPEYKDGDLVGLDVDHPVIIQGAGGGYGIQYSQVNTFWFSNRFSKEVTNSFMYKYEAGVHWSERYANTYQPSNGGFSVQPGISSVVGGEKYQRVECGYGYWLRPEGWPPIAIEPWGDTIFSQAIRSDVTLTDFKPGVMPIGSADGNIVSTHDNVYVDVYNIEDKNLALALDGNATFSEGSLDLYRVIDPNAKNEIGPTSVPTSVIYRFKSFFFQRGPVDSPTNIRSGYSDKLTDHDDRFFSRIGGSGHADVDYAYIELQIKNNGSITVKIPSTPVEIGPGDSYTFTTSELNMNNLALELPGNSNFDFGTSKYLTANYAMTFKNIILKRRDNTNFTTASHSAPYTLTIGGTHVSADTTPIEYHMRSRWGALRTQYNGNDESCHDDGTTLGGSTAKWLHSVYLDGPYFPVRPKTGDSNFADVGFYATPIDTGAADYCGGGKSYNDQVFSVPIEVI